MQDRAAGPDGGGQGRAAGSGILSPMLALPGARLAPAADPAGLPLPGVGAAPYTAFIHPVAASAYGDELYVADSGAGRIFRFSAALNTMTPVRFATAVPGTRLAVGPDFSVYVLDPPRRRVLRLARDGRVLATYADAVNLTRPIAFATDDIRGEVLVADELYRHLVAFHPLGGAARVIPLRGDGRNRVLGIAAIALARDVIHIADPSCRCVVVAGRDGGVRTAYGHHEIGLPGAIAVDRHDRVFVADALDRSIKVFAAGRLIDNVPAAGFGLREVGDLAVSGSRLVVADGAGAGVAILQIAPPRRGE